MQYYKRREAEVYNGMVSSLGDPRTTHREWGNIREILPAKDVWVFADDPARDPDRLYMTIKNPSKPYRPAY